MDFIPGFVPDFAWWQWVLIAFGLVGYIAVWAVVWTFLMDNVSEKAAILWAFTLGLPVSFVVLVVYGTIITAVWPWKWYQKARFHGIFDFWPQNDEHSFELDQLVQQALELRAENFGQACYDQEDARRRKATDEFVKLSEFDAEVKRAKKEFWRAHGLAKRFRFTVHDSFRDYLRKRPDLVHVQG